MRSKMTRITVPNSDRYQYGIDRNAQVAADRYADPFGEDRVTECCTLPRGIQQPPSEGGRQAEQEDREKKKDRDKERGKKKFDLRQKHMRCSTLLKLANTISAAVKLRLNNVDKMINHAPPLFL
ncbi:hypothetical protein WN51_02822 [Melipona quadrifasciata]|uniref:Uncharacterized protein n=1 Tax=Melipona quadrifasciata TaxID=166423 RepID=A0A0M9AA17_9HYME|nr:hypothetical protein WN51_02822 [Melipona quadrifasciata]